MINVKEAAAAVAANQKFTRKDALDLARFGAVLTLVPTLLIALIGSI